MPMPGTCAELVGLADASSYLSGRGQIISKCQRPAAPMPEKSPIQMAVDFSRSQAQCRLFKACGDPVGANIDWRVSSELYPLPAAVVADYRSTLTQFGKPSRLDFRPPYQGAR